MSTVDRPCRRHTSIETNTVEDRTLVERASHKDDAKAFARLVTRHSDLVYRVAFGMLGREEAQDAYQEVWIRTWRGISKFQGNSSFTTWLYRIAVNTCLDIRRAGARRRSRESPGLLPNLSDGGNAPEAAALNRERHDEIHEALRDVRSEHRAALVLRHMEGMSYAEVATTLGVPQGTVKGWVHRGQAALLKAMSQKTATPALT